MNPIARDSSKPRVSVCVPAYQAGEYLSETLDSVWKQDFKDFELVVVDDGSTDTTAQVLADQSDSRLRVFRHQPNVGQARSVTELIARARGEYVKFLDADDLLHRDCLSKMTAALDEHPTAAFVFSHRDVLIESDDDQAAKQWLEAGSAHLPSKFGAISVVNDGSDLIARYAEGGFSGNWIAEPAGVMARRTDLIAVGGYSTRVRLATDMDLWLRLLTRGDAVFIDEPLYTYRFAFTGVTGHESVRGDMLVEPLWMAEGLTQTVGVSGTPTAGVVRSVRRKLLVQATRVALGAAVRRRPGSLEGLRVLGGYLGYRVAHRFGTGAALHVPWPETSET